MASNKSNLDYDVMVVGGGPAGISTWLHLHKYAPDIASRTVLIEKEKYPRDKLCGGGVGAWSNFVLNNLEVDINIPSIVVSDVEFRYGQEIFTLHQHDSFLMVQRTEFDHALARTAVNRGLLLCENETFLDVAYMNDFLVVTTNKGKYKVKVLVGADGSLSMVRRKMRLTNRPHLAPTLEIFSTADPKYDAEYCEKKIVVDLTPMNEGLQGYVWHVPCIKNGIPSIGHGLVDMRVYPNKPLADMKKIFARELKNRNIARTQKLWLSHPIRWYSSEDVISQPNILLVGDAVGIEPAFGGGIHFALLYGGVAAKTIVNAIRKDDFSFNDYKKSLGSHLIGKFINKCTRIALAMYDFKMNPLDAAREVFTIENEKQQK